MLCDECPITPAIVGIDEKNLTHLWHPTRGNQTLSFGPGTLELRRHPDFKLHVCVTGQHRQMLDQVLEVFEVVPDVDLNLMQPDQMLARLTSGAATATDSYLTEHRSTKSDV